MLKCVPIFNLAGFQFLQPFEPNSFKHIPHESNFIQFLYTLFSKDSFTQIIPQL